MSTGTKMFLLLYAFFATIWGLALISYLGGNESAATPLIILPIMGVFGACLAVILQEVDKDG